MAKTHPFVMALALSIGLALPSAAQDVTAATVVARVNGVEITLGHLIAARDALPEQYKALPNETLFKGVMDQLIQQAALEQTVEGKLALRDTLPVGTLAAEVLFESGDLFSRRVVIDRGSRQGVLPGAPRVGPARVVRLRGARGGGATPRCRRRRRSW